MTSSTPITYYDFSQRVRRFRRTDLLEALAKMAAALHRHEFGEGPDPRQHGATAHWSLAGVAIASLRHGNDYRPPGVSSEDVAMLCSLYVNVHEPSIDQAPMDLRGLFHRTVYEQFPYQISMMEELGRSTALLLRAGADCDLAPTANTWRQTLGASLEDFVAVGLALHVAALRRNGTIRWSELGSSDWDPVWEQLDTVADASAAIRIAETFFCQTVNDIRAQTVDRSDPYAKWAFNPLLSRPLVRLDDDRLIAPVPRLLLHRVSPTGLYFIGLDKFGSSFTDALGCLFEEYVGAQLRTLPEATVIPEITYGKSQKKTVDWFLVLDDLILLVEAKAHRPVETTRLGLEAGDDNLLTKVGKGINQIQNTYELIRDGQPELDFIPTDRPIGGLVVTLEPFHLVNTLIWDQDLPECDIPVAIASSHELEDTVGALQDAQDIGQRVHAALAPPPPTPPSLAAAADGLIKKPNPILDHAWAKLSWH